MEYSRDHCFESTPDTSISSSYQTKIPKLYHELGISEKNSQYKNEMSTFIIGVVA